MKGLRLLIPILAGALVPVTVVQAEEPMTRAEALAVCKAIATAARTVMTARQNGVPMVRVMEDAGDNVLLQDIVADAYGEMLWPDIMPAQRQSAITEFENKHYAACVKEAPRE